MLLLTYREFTAVKNVPTDKLLTPGERLVCMATHKSLSWALKRVRDYAKFCSTRRTGDHCAIQEYTFIAATKVAALSKESLDAGRITLIDDLPTNEQQYQNYFGG